MQILLYDEPVSCPVENLNFPESFIHQEGDVKHYHFEEMEAHNTGERIQRVVAGERLTVLRQKIQAGVDMYNPHSHPNEQITIVLEGQARFACGGKEVVLGPGGVVVFPPNEEHSTRNAGNGPLVLEEIFTPGVESLNKRAPAG